MSADPSPEPPAAATAADDAAAEYDAAPCGLLSTDRGGVLVRVNDTFLQWTGHTRAALLAGRRFTDLLTAPGRIFHGTQFAPLLHLQGFVREVAFDVRCADGTALPVLVNAAAVKGDDGRVTATRLALFDATQGRRREQELLLARRNAERLSAVVACTGDAIFSVTAAGLIDGWNAGSERLFGTALAAALGRPVTDVVSLAHPDRWVAVLGQVTGGGDGPSEAVELELSTGGPVRWVSVAVSAIRDALDRVTGMSALARDVTDRWVAERLRANEATARQATAVAEAASRAKSDFLANMSHEIRTPLNGVVGMLQLLAGTPLAADQRRQVDVAQSSAAALLTLINDILDFSKIEAGKLQLDPVPFDLADVADAAAAIVAPRAGAKGLSLTCAVDPSVARRRVGPADRVRQVLINLLGNAVKFTAAGSIALAVTAEGEDGVRFAVTDTGIGIPPDRIDRLFKTFSQVDASTTRKYGGTGLGLAISKQLAELMGGAVGVESVVGAGSTFWFSARLPVDVATVTAAPAAVHAVATPAGRRVLVAEDNDVNQMVVGEMLRRLGYAHDVVGDGRAAVAAVAGGGYDLVLMDCQMPEMDGFEAAAALRAAEAAAGRPRLPVIALTANAIKGDRERCLAAGMDDYLTKPLDAAALAATLAAWSGTRARDAAA